MSDNSEVYPLKKEQIEEIVKDATLRCMGRLRVTNHGGFYASVELGVYIVEKQKHKEQIKKSREALYVIFLKLIERYHNFERGGYYHYFDKGSWRRFKTQ